MSYPNPDAKRNPYGPADGLRDLAAQMQPEDFPQESAENIGVSPMPSKSEHMAALSRSQPTPGAAPPGYAPQNMDPMQDPGFRSFLAQQAKGLDELKAAQGQAQSSRDSLGMRVGNGLIALGMVGGGQGSPDAMINSRMQQADQPVRDVMQRQEFGQKATTGAQAEAGLAGTLHGQSVAAMAQDPNSPMSKRAQSMWAPILGDRAKYLTASDVDQAEKAGTIDVQRLHNLATERMAQAEMTHKGAELAQKTKHETAEEVAKNRQLDIDAGKVKYEMDQKGRVPEQEASKLINMQQAEDALREVQDAYHRSGPSDMMPNTDYNRLLDAKLALIAAGAAPAARENPKLMEEFKSGFPTRYTPDKNGDVYFDGLKDAIRKNRAAQVGALSAGGYKPEQVAALGANAASAPAQGSAAPSGSMRMRAPDGSEHMVDALKVAAAKAAGGVVLSP